jgi:hypothetical protein
VCAASRSNIQRDSFQQFPDNSFVMHFFETEFHKRCITMNTLAQCLHVWAAHWALVGSLEESRSLYVDALEGSGRIHGQNHPDTLAVMINTAALLAKVNKCDETAVLRCERSRGSHREVRII